MVFLYWLMGVIAAIALYCGIRTLGRFLKKSPLYQKEDIKKDLIDGGTAISLPFAFAILMFFFFKTYYFFNGCVFFFCFSLSILLLRPSSIIELIKSKNFINKKTILSGILVFFFAIETFFFNSGSYDSGLTETEINFSSSLILENKGAPNEDSTNYSYTEDSYILLSMPSDAEYITFVTDGHNVSEQVYITFYIANQSNSLEQYKVNPVREETLRVAIPSAAKGTDTKIVFEFDTGRYKDPVSLTLKTILINAPRTFNFSFIRFLLVMGISYFFAAFLPNAFLKKENEGILNATWWNRLTSYRKAYISVGALTLMAFIVFLIYAYANPNGFFNTYEYVESNIQNIVSVDIYSDLFYSILHGRISLTKEASASLIAAESEGINVYSQSIRSKLGISAAWDHAYYHGKYYSYYGILPIFLVYFPAYLLSGCNYIPTPLFGLFIGTIFLVPSVYLLLLEIDRNISKGKTNFKNFHVLFVCALFLMLTINHLCLKDGTYHEGIYHLPIVFGVVEVTLFLLFAWRAYRKVDKRMVNLILSGLFYASLSLTRPNLCLAIIFACPLFFAMLFDKKVTWKKRIISFSSLFGVLIIGFSLAFIYNYIRYESLFEFGQSYQMNGDQLTEVYKVNTYSVDKFLPAMYHFLFQGPAFYSYFPYLSCSSTRFSFDICSYISGSYGVFLIPFFILMLASPFIFKENKTFRFFFSLLPIFIVFFVFTTYSKGGVCARYLIENFYFSTLASMGVMMYLLNSIQTNEEKNVTAPAILYVLLFVSCFICLNISYDTFDGQTIGDAGGLLVKIRSAFTPFYY